MPRQTTNLFTEVPGHYIYLQKNRRYAAYKRYPDPTALSTKKFFDKGGLFYSFEEAKEWLLLLPDKMERPTRCPS
jgi:hypothetical protein